MHRIQDPHERAQEAALNSVQTISGNMALSSNPLPAENIEAIFEHDRAPSGVSLSKVLEALALRRLHGEISERVARLDKKNILKLGRYS